MDVRLDTTLPEYNANVEPSRLLKMLTLQSTSVDCGASLAAAFVEGDKLFLLPIDGVGGQGAVHQLGRDRTKAQSPPSFARREGFAATPMGLPCITSLSPRCPCHACDSIMDPSTASGHLAPLATPFSPKAMQLRPSMAHLDAERDGGKKAAAKDEDGPDAGVLMPVMVQVKKRETEAQQEARLRSFAHITAQEAAEEWVVLQYHDDASEVRRCVEKSVGLTMRAFSGAACISLEQPSRR